MRRSEGTGNYRPQNGEEIPGGVISSKIEFWGFDFNLLIAYSKKRPGPASRDGYEVCGVSYILERFRSLKSPEGFL